MAQAIEPDEIGVELEDRVALDYLFSVTYEELRHLASTVKRSYPNATLSPTTLVNEAWLKLANNRALPKTSPLHFKRIAARAMRQVLVEAARHRNAQKRGGGAPIAIAVDDSLGDAGTWGSDLLALDAALDELAALQPRQAVLVESRFFGGLSVAETAKLLDISEATVLRDWRAARAWLSHELRHTK
jgi:RNA polymerase sigma factor (TIGR02999 family)